MFDVEIIDTFNMGANAIKCRTYYKSTLVHRADGPAKQQWHRDGSIYLEEWYMDGDLHHVDGPAISQWNSDGSKFREEWFLNGAYHRVDGPAFSQWLDNRVLHYQLYSLYGVEITEEIKEWAIEVGIPDITNMTPEQLAMFKLTWR